MELHQCSRCGADLRREGNAYRCAYCRAEYEDDFEERAAYTLQNALEEAKIERLASARRVLYDAAHVRFPSKDAVLDAARNVLAIYPDDILAKIYVLSHETDPYDLAFLLPGLTLPKAEADEVMQWLIPSLHPRLVGPLQDFTMRHYRDEERTRYLTALEDEAAKLQEGIYEAGLARDVFLCYSSADMPKVVHILDLLEENGFQCFAAFRNLRHGKGSADNYLAEIRKAMGACTVFLFLSSASSRSATCDALRVEMPMLLENHPSKPRIEYILEDYGSHVPLLVKATLKKVFPEQEHCRDEEDLVMRVSDLLRANVAVSTPKPAQPKPEPEPVVVEEPVQEASNPDDFVIEERRDGVHLIKYKGHGRHVVLPPGITHIDCEAFSGSAIESFESNGDLQEIWDKAFANCRNLKTVTIVPNVVKGVTMRGHPFVGDTIERFTAPCSSLPEGYYNHSSSVFSKAVIGTLVLTSNGTPAIQNIVQKSACQSRDKEGNVVTIREIILEDGIEIIESDAFYGIHGVESIQIPESVTTFGSRAFYGYEVERAVVPASLLDFKSESRISARHYVVKGGNGYLAHPPGCSITESIVFEDGYETIPGQAFAGLTKLRKLVLPSTLTEIRKQAFSRCSSLTDLELPDGIVKVGEELFYETSMRVHIRNKALKRVLHDGRAFLNSKAKLIIDR